MMCSCEQDYTCDACRVAREPVGKPANVQAALGEYEAVLKRIYDERTAGDFTFLGVLADFALTLKDLEG